VLPDDLDLLAGTVMPLARRRGLARTGYAGTTLREHLGFVGPRSRFVGRAMEHPAT
jgi:hypothetical protein